MSFMKAKWVHPVVILYSAEHNMDRVKLALLFH
jgi:hypothetical protein